MEEAFSGDRSGAERSSRGHEVTMYGLDTRLRTVQGTGGPKGRSPTSKAEQEGQKDTGKKRTECSITPTTSQQNYHPIFRRP